MRRWLLTIGLPVVFVAGYFVFDYAPSFIEDAYDDFAGPFLLMYWFGLLFSNMYFVLVEDLKGEGAGPGTIAAMAGGLALLFFVAGGGPPVIWRDPWMFGAAIKPGVDIAWPYVRDRLHHARTGALSPDAEGPLPQAETAADVPAAGGPAIER
jgi:hypothetical protein